MRTGVSNDILLILGTRSHLVLLHLAWSPAKVIAALHLQQGQRRGILASVA